MRLKNLLIGLATGIGAVLFGLLVIGLGITFYERVVQADQQRPQPTPAGPQVVMDHVFYVFDSNKNLCYAVLPSGTFGDKTVLSLTQVPLTKENCR